MDEQRIPAFSGIAGQVVLDSFSAELFINGILIAVALGIPFGLAALAKNAFFGLAAVLWGLFLHGLVVGRFAQQGLAGESQGLLGSSVSGDSWGSTTALALRYLTLWLVWSLPLFAMGMFFGLTSLGKTPTQPPAVLTFYSLTMFVVPPVFLSVAAGASRFGEIFSPDLWRNLFAGRWGDMFLIGVLFLGSMIVPIILLSPLFSLVGPTSFKALGALSICLGAALIILSATLHGRLCGFFVRQLTAPQVLSSPSTVVSSGGVPVAVGGMALTSAGPGVFAGTPLVDADERLQAIRQQFQADPQAAVRQLDELHGSFAPNPKVLHALCQARQLTGDMDGAVAAAREGIPLCLTHGQTALAVDMLRATLPQVLSLQLPPIQLLPVIEALEKSGDVRGTIHAYAALVTSNPGETRAVKGLLRAAEHLLRKENAPEDAAKVYKYLLHHCSGSPLEVFMREGLTEAERKMANA